MAGTLKRIVNGQAHIGKGVSSCYKQVVPMYFNPVNKPKSVSASGHEIMDRVRVNFCFILCVCVWERKHPKAFKIILITYLIYKYTHLEKLAIPH